MYELLDQAYRLGARFIVPEPGRVRVEASVPLPNELMAELRKCKAEVLEVLTRLPSDTAELVAWPEKLEHQEPPLILVGQSSIGNGGLASAEEQICFLTTWAGNDPKQWKRIHSTLLRIYSPAWVHVEHRCILVAWVAASLAFSRATVELTRLESLRRRLTKNDRTIKASRHADVNFWGRLIRRLEPQIPTALAQDTEAVAVLDRIVRRNE